MASILALKDIPSVAQLYRSKDLERSGKDDLPAPNQEFNNKVSTVQYDITKLEVDAIVNAANKSLLGGGGVDGAIHRAAGRGLYEECKGLDGCDTGASKITDGYDLPAKKVIHTVGPIYQNDEESEPYLRGCYKSSLELAVEHGCKSIAFSAISTGIYGYPGGTAAKIAVGETLNFLRSPAGNQLDKIIFCNFLDKDVGIYAKTLPLFFPPTEADLAEASEYQNGDPIPGDNLPTSESQTRPSASSNSSSTSNNAITTAIVDFADNMGNTNSKNPKAADDSKPAKEEEWSMVANLNKVEANKQAEADAPKTKTNDDAARKGSLDLEFTFPGEHDHQWVKVPEEVNGGLWPAGHYSCSQCGKVNASL